MRVFIAINFPTKIRVGMWEAAEPLRSRSFPFRWVQPDALHLTLKFLGELASAREPEIIGGLKAAVHGVRPFSLRIADFGAFPSLKRPRVVWVGCEGVPALELLQHQLEKEMDRLGFPVEGRPFQPHITLGRLRRDARPRSLADFPGVLAGLSFASDAFVGSVDLMQSELRRDGARYAVRHAAELGT
jgi:2'-5' RNA ligase